MNNVTTRNALNAYSQAGVEISVSAASPHKLIAMLYEGALVAINVARGHMLRKEIGPKGEALSKAIAIIEEGLKVSLDEESGGDLARNLKSLYEYMGYRLLMANLKNDVDGLDEVSRLLFELKGAWDQIGKQPQEAAPPPAVGSPPPRTASVSYGKA